MGTLDSSDSYCDNFGKIAWKYLTSLTGFWFDCTTSLPWSLNDYFSYQVTPSILSDHVNFCPFENYIYFNFWNNEICTSQDCKLNHYSEPLPYPLGTTPKGSLFSPYMKFLTDFPWFVQSCDIANEKSGLQSEARILRVVKVLRILKITRILKAFKVVECVPSQLGCVV